MSDAAEAIRRTIAEYCEFYDERLFDAFEGLWTEEATFRVHGRPGGAKGPKEIAAYLERRTQSTRGPQPTLRTMHGSFNPLLDIHGNEAEAWCDYCAFSVRGGAFAIGGGRYHFRLVRAGEHWLIADLEARLIAPEVARPRPDDVGWPQQVTAGPGPSMYLDGRSRPLARMDEREEVRRTIAEYAQLYDERRYDEFAQIWTAEATFRVAGRPGGVQGRTAIAAYLERRTNTKRGPQPSLRALHGVFTPQIELAGREAVVRADYMAVSMKPEGLSIGSAGRYHFRLVREPDRWRIADLETHLLASDLERARPAGATWPTGTMPAPRPPLRLPAHEALDEDEAVRRTIVEYRAAESDGRLADYEQLWSEGGVLRVQGREQGLAGRSTIRAYLEERWRTRTTKTPSMGGLFNPVIEVVGARAAVRVDFLTLGGEALPFRVTGGGRYYFQLAKEAQGWRIAEMEVRPLAPEIGRPRPAGTPAWPGGAAAQTDGSGKVL